jgi:hypothetical protein
MYVRESRKDGRPLAISFGVPKELLLSQLPRSRKPLPIPVTLEIFSIGVGGRVRICSCLGFEVVVSGTPKALEPARLEAAN